MSLRLFRIACLVLLLPLCACSAPAPRSTPPVADAPPAALLLVSIDGLRADALGRGDTPNLDRLAAGGVRARWMRPSYPVLTFPNHYTLVTGLRPDHHGIVHNTMHDPELGGFKLSDREAVGEARWWGGEPLWNGARKAGLGAATMFWPGSEAPIQGLHPQRWMPFDAAMPSQARADQVLAWLAEPAATRPRLVTLYFDAVDSAGHAHGPASAQVRAAIRETDAALGHLFDGLAALDLPGGIDIVVVSDHGMAAVAPDHQVAVEDMVAPEQARVVSIGQVVGIEPLPGQADAVERRLLGAHERFDCWRKGELPARWHYGSHPRIPPIVCQMHEGWDALPRAYLAHRREAGPRGSHGFDPELPSMRAVFVAAGPSFREGMVLPPFDNVDVYPLLAQLLGIPPAPNDGDPRTLLPALAVPVAAPASQ
ncbi:ectonucleotide pyrophosphatase/phosphodiesterase [Pseudoxanthomonas koreensis]|uniref:alkaline phosphatase family protein n=1 Tax=Pseudoxanthomonas koreensis TaxID=266061 RepID=UPI001390FD80|nr:ectonucleotide pyrophosphatase/phosphodiesterase [Pseudoxanthomonas koreensis]KAF1689239.1 alkaline phosphatase family protein [Pseudoxanthomonas koreensis]